jgi:hypothetical protein
MEKEEKLEEKVGFKKYDEIERDVRTLIKKYDMKIGLASSIPSEKDFRISAKCALWKAEANGFYSEYGF